MKRSVKTLKNIIADELFDVSNYPACKTFFPITEAVGDVFTEIVTGDTVTLAGLVAGTITHGTYYISNDDLAAAASSAGELPNAPQIPNTKDLIWLVVADFTVIDKSVALGGGNAKVELRNKAANSNLVTDDASSTQVLSVANALDTDTEAAAIYMDRANSKLSTFETDGVAVVTNTLEVFSAGTGSYNFSAANSLLSFSPSVNLYGAILFAFDTLPTDLNAALSWMNYQWRQGNKVIYPAWKNKV